MRVKIAFGGRLRGYTRILGRLTSHTLTTEAQVSGTASCRLLSADYTPGNCTTHRQDLGIRHKLGVAAFTSSTIPCYLVTINVPYTRAASSSQCWKCSCFFLVVACHGIQTIPLGDTLADCGVS
jgi:hypothetical protein